LIHFYKRREIVEMWRLLVSLSLFAGQGLTYDKYADALAKYQDWQEKYGTVVQKKQERLTRHSPDYYVNRVGDVNAIFLPHRPRNGGKQFIVSDISSQNQDFPQFENELYSPAVTRGTRGSSASINEVGLGGSEYISANGVPLYKLRKRYPHYGRRRRSTDDSVILSRVPRQQGGRGWVLLDPNTGRPVEDAVSDLEPNLRNTRKPVDESFQQQPSDISYRTFQDKEGNTKPIYQYYKKYPFGYSSG